MHEVRHIDHYICTRTKSSTHMVCSSSSNAVMVMAATTGTAGIMLELYLREVVLFLDVVSIDTCNRIYVYICIVLFVSHANPCACMVVDAPVHTHIRMYRFIHP